MVGLVTAAPFRPTGGITESFQRGRRSVLDERNLGIQQALATKAQLTDEARVGIAGRKVALEERKETRLTGEAERGARKEELEINKLTDAQDARELFNIARAVQLVDNPEQKRAFLEGVEPQTEFTAAFVSEALEELGTGDIQGFNQFIDGMLAFQQDVAQSPLGEILSDIKAGFIPVELGKLELANRLSGSESEKQKTVKEFMKQFDIDAPTATALANGLIASQLDPVTEKFGLQSLVPGKIVGEEGLIPDERLAPQPVPAEAPDITGGINVLEEFGGPADVAARFGELVPFLSDIFTGEDETQAKVIMDSLGIDIELAFSKNNRRPEGEVKRLQKLIPKGGFFSTLSASQNRLKGLKTAVESISFEETNAGNNESLGAASRRQSRENANNANNLIVKIDQILAASQEFNPEDIAAELKRRGLQ